MKAVLISIQPKWVEKIISGKKTIEIRKTAPKTKTPFKCYIYCTYGNMKENYGFGKSGKVIGEFICDKIYRYVPLVFKGQEFYQNFMQSEEFATCLTQEDLKEYGKGKDLYGWHISDIKIYDKPKELSEFGQRCETATEIRCRDCKINDKASEFCKVMVKPLTRPPQSWCYVEE